MEHNFQPLLFGGDINVYSVARAFHEAYGVKSVCFGKFASGPAYGSTILDYRVCPQNEDAATFRKNVADVAAEFAGKTVLVIAHRMRTVAGADHIVVLENGRVAQQGSPAQLMAEGGLYRRMVELQTEASGWSLAS